MFAPETLLKIEFTKIAENDFLPGVSVKSVKRPMTPELLHLYGSSNC